jgi:4-amino-4-deoxy-L-arabinose transferase-like glycosyltransferase
VSATPAGIDTTRIDADAPPSRYAPFGWWCWLGGAVLLVALRWLLVERHAPFGDEPAHLDIGAALSAALHASTSWSGFFSTAYFGVDGRYPPLAYLVFEGATWLARDPLLAARAVNTLFGVGAALLAARCAADLTGRSRDGWITALLLVGMPMFQEATRYALLEAHLLFWTALVLFAWVQHLRTRRIGWWALLVAALIAGLLTKFSFVLYVAPLAFVALIADVAAAWSEERRAKAFGRAALRWTASLAVVAIVAGPWYLANLRNPANAQSGLAILVEVGHLRLARTPADIWALVAQAAPMGYSKVALVVLPLVFAAWLLGLLRAIVRRARPTPRGFVVAALALAIVALVVAMPMLGVGDQIRWHLQYLFVAVAFPLMLAAVPSTFLRTMLAVLVGMSALLQIAALQGAPPPPQLRAFVADAALWQGGPDPRSTGMEEIAAYVRDELPPRDAASDPRGPVRVVFLMHEHRGAHSTALAWALARVGRTDVVVERAAFFDRPIDLPMLLASDLLVVSEAEPMRGDRETDRHQRFEERLPGILGASGTPDREIVGRHQRLRLLRPDLWPRDETTLARLLAAAAEADERASMRPIYELEGRLLACRYRVPIALDPARSDETIAGEARTIAAETPLPTRIVIESLLRELAACTERSSDAD